MTNSEARYLGADESGLPLSEDLMTGADAIARFMFGEATETNKRRVYHAADKLGLPAFKFGSTICARRSTIIAWIKEQERTV
ncbi:cytidine deaminase [Methylobacterium sp. BE186]|uniref:DNA-binding protein n=1 Tax=Methylobacterium sp. BE186 TaxID=2817715 RepID=UPI0028557B93|nr:DNA-binding protein [Methylobacterium sp. BE186]MDR7039631.1 cytidine deaminase [Methylobacterium sp. BE186]